MENIFNVFRAMDVQSLFSDPFYLVLCVHKTHRLIRSGTIRKCALAGVKCGLVGSVSPWGWALKFQKLKLDLVSLSSVTCQ